MVREMWCENPRCPRHVTPYEVQWTESDLSGPAWPVTDSCKRCGAGLLTEDERSRHQDNDFYQVPA